MKKLASILFLSALFFQVYAQEATLEGIVSDAEGQPMEFSNVLLFQASDTTFLKGTITDFDGSYSFNQVSAGNYFIEASLVGFGANRSEMITVEEGSTSIAVSHLILTAGVELEEVVVTSQRPLIELKADKVVMNVQGSSVAVGNTALEVLAKSPGVNVDQDNNISLKGKQGVLILIDGKNQYVSNEQLARLLETMPANSIDKIEIMHNPSAKFDASGNAGVINIKLKKNENLGYNGTMTLGAGQGRFPKSNAGINLNFRQEKFNVYGNYDFRYWKGFQDISISRSIPLENTFSLFDQSSDMQNASQSNNYKVGVDFFLSDKTTMGVLTRGSFGNWEYNNSNFTTISGLNIQGFDQSNTVSLGIENWDQVAANFNVQHKFTDKSELSFDFDYSQFDNPTNASYDNFFYDTDMNPVMDPFYIRNQNSVDVSIIASKLDYNISLNNGMRIESGIKVSDVVTDNSIYFENMINEEWQMDASLTNDFSYNEGIFAAYVNASKSIGKVMVQGGLRMENTSSDGFSPTLEQHVTRSYTDFFPSLSISHSFKDKHSLSYSYSRRIDRPTYKRLNPFVYFLDQFTFQQGNPFLDPQITNSLGINYGLQNKLYVSANFSRTKEAMTEILGQNDETQQTFQTIVNLENFNNYSLNVTAPVIFNKSWSGRLSLTSFYNDFESSSTVGQINEDMLSYNIHFANDFTINQNFKAELTAYYQSRLIYGIFEIDPRYSVDIGFSHKVMGGLGQFKLNVKDVFATMNNEVHVNQNTIDLTVFSAWESRRVNLAFNYNFGNQKVKRARNRRTATSDEERRVSTGSN